MTAVTDYEPRTYRGATLEELLPKIREELGPDAIIVRQREGLDGGLGGFFQRRCVEVVARRPGPGVDAYDSPAPVAPPAAVVPEPPAPAIREIMRVASPFIDQLQAAEVAAASPEPAPAPAPDDEVQRAAEEQRAAAEQQRAEEQRAAAEQQEAEEQQAAAEQQEPDPGSDDEQAPGEDQEGGDEHPPGGEQPVTGAFGASAYTVTAGGAMVSTRQSAAELAPLPALQLVTHQASAVTPFDPRPLERVEASSREPEPEPVAASATRTDEAAAHEQALVAAGIAPALAADLIDATISHIVPFGPKRALKRALRKALARRIPIAPPFASGGHAIAFVGAGGSGKTLCAARLATAYAQHSDLGVTVMSLAPPERAAALRAVLDPAGIYVLDARSLEINHVCGERVLTIIDTPPLSPAATDEIKRLAGELRRLGDPAVHLAVPATLSSAAVRTLLDGFAPLDPVAIAITHLDEVGHAGPVIDEAIARGLAVSYTSDGSGTDGFAPADAAALAAGVLA